MQSESKTSLKTLLIELKFSVIPGANDPREVPTHRQTGGDTTAWHYPLTDHMEFFQPW
jgi:hypothetical protein